MATMKEDASGRRQRAVMATDAEWERIGRAAAESGMDRLCCKPDVGVSQIRTTTVLSSCFCVGQTVL